MDKAQYVQSGDHRWRIVKMTVGVSSAEYHSLHRVGAAVYIFMGEGGPTLVTTADV